MNNLRADNRPTECKFSKHDIEEFTYGKKKVIPYTAEIMTSILWSLKQLTRANDGHVDQDM